MMGRTSHRSKEKMINEISTVICKYFGTSIEAVKGSYSSGMPLQARNFISYFACRHEAGPSEIGRFLEHDHSTVVVARGRVIFRVMSDHFADPYRHYHKELCGLLNVDYFKDLGTLNYEAGILVKGKAGKAVIRKNFENMKTGTYSWQPAKEIVEQAKPIIRFKGTYSNSNWELELEERAKALAI